jgi:hypothetical protein
MKLLHFIVYNRLTEDRVNKLLFIQINLRTLRRLPRIPKDLIQGESHEMETDESDLEVELDCGPYQLVPWIVQRVSQDPPVAGVIPAGPVQPTPPTMR